jgi:hypothetical protein
VVAADAVQVKLLQLYAPLEVEEPDAFTKKPGGEQGPPGTDTWFVVGTPSKGSRTKQALFLTL